LSTSRSRPADFSNPLDRLGRRPDEVKFTGDIYFDRTSKVRARGGNRGAVIDQHERYTWVEHEKIVHIRDLHRIERD